MFLSVMTSGRKSREHGDITTLLVTKSNLSQSIQQQLKISRIQYTEMLHEYPTLHTAMTETVTDISV